MPPSPDSTSGTLMVVVAVAAAAGLWVGIPLCELFFFSDPLTSKRGRCGLSVRLAIRRLPRRLARSCSYATPEIF